MRMYLNNDENYANMKSHIEYMTVDQLYDLGSLLKKENPTNYTETVRLRILNILISKKIQEIKSLSEIM